MKMKLVVALLLVVSVLFSGSPFDVPRAAAGPDVPPPEEGGTLQHLGNKGVLIGLPPGTIVAHFVVKGKDSPLLDGMGVPHGVFMGDIVGSADGKPVEASLIVSDTDDANTATQNRLFIWTEEGGYELLSTLTVLSQQPETKIWVDDAPIEN